MDRKVNGQCSDDQDRNVKAMQFYPLLAGIPCGKLPCYGPTAQGQLFNYYRLRWVYNCTCTIRRLQPSNRLKPSLHEQVLFDQFLIVEKVVRCVPGFQQRDVAKTCLVSWYTNGIKTFKENVTCRFKVLCVVYIYLAYVWRIQYLC